MVEMSGQFTEALQKLVDKRHRPSAGAIVDRVWTFSKGVWGLLKSHVHPAQYVNGVCTSMQYLQTTCSVDLVIVLFRVDNTCHRSCDLVTCHTLCCI